MKLGYLGPAGTFSHEVAMGFVERMGISGSDLALVPQATKLDVLEAVSDGNVDVGIVPIENSIGGSVPETVDGLLRYGNLFIQTEVVLPVSQNLMALPGTTVEALTEVWSHPQGIAQCRNWLHRSGCATTQFSSTAGAAKAVRDSGRSDVAAIANRAAADVFGLAILVSNLQDEAENHTRFVVVARGNEAVQNASKTMVLLTPSEERSGVLAAILNVLAALALNLTWIESRPTKKRLGAYQFFLDVEAGMHEPRLANAVSILKILGHDVRVLGSYDSITL